MGDIILKKKPIAFHTEPQKTAPVILLFTVTSLILNFFLIMSVNSYCTQLNALLQSNYDYSVTTQKPVLENDYYRFDAGIYFALSADAETSLNADIVMQSADSVYTDLVCWNAEPLSTYGIAVSKNLAMAYHLDRGDKLYSKHIVSGEICEYSVEQILPEAINVMASEAQSYSNGIIIMGYDEQYIENITHHFIVFSKEPIDELSAKCGGTAEGIIYRGDEMIAEVKTMIPYLAVFGAASILITVLTVALLTKNLSHNFRRIVMLGFEKKRLNRSYYRFVIGYGILSTVAAVGLSCSVFLFVEVSAVRVLLLMFMPLVEIITLFTAGAKSNKRLWRK